MSLDPTKTAWRKSVRPRVMRTSIIATALFVVGMVAYRNESWMWLGILILFAAALVVGENLELRLTDRAAIPISFAAIMALARTTTNVGNFSWVHTSCVIIGSIFLSTLCYSEVRLISRIKILTARTIIYFVGLAAAYGCLSLIDETTQWLYAALIVAIVTMLAAHELLALIDGYPRVYGFFAAAAHASIIAGGVLVGVGYAGTKGVFDPHSPEAFVNGLGISALVTCAIPLLVAWFAFARYYGALKTYKQTIRALSAAPELGGIVAWGHTDRVAQIALAISDRIDLSHHDREAIETACYMHTLGDAVLDTTIEVDPYEEAQAAQITADIIRQTGGLDRVADIIDDHVRPYRGVVDGNLIAQNDIAASVMRAANDYDNISRREETWGVRALQAMHEAPTATYNPRAIEALEWVISNPKFSYLVEPPEMPQRIMENLTR